MNLSLTLNFDSIGELENFLKNRASTAVAAVSPETVAPSPVLEVVPPPVAAPTAVVDPLSDVAETLGDAIGNADLRPALMARLRTMAGDMDDPAVLGKFINGFGVARFSEIADEDLPAFKTALDAEFGA